MDDGPDAKLIEADAKLIDDLGGPAKVCELLGYEKDGGVQRVHNWKTRGIPSHVKVRWPHYFMPDALRQADKPDKPLTKIARQEV